MSATPDEATHAAADGVELDLSARIARAAALQQPGRRLSRNAVLAMVVGFTLVGVTAGVADNFLNAHVGGTGPTGTSPLPAATPTPAPAAAAGTPRLSVPTASTLATPSPHGLAGLLGLVDARGPAPAFQLVDQHRRIVSLAGLRGQAVVLSFFDADCHDICPVLATELRLAAHDLGAAATGVTFLTINSDPLRTGTAAAAEGARASGLGESAGLARWHFLSGTLGQLDAVWASYGITVDVRRATGTVSHNDTLWFIRPSGTVAYEATPFADEQRGTGTFHLAAATERRYAAGIARYARRLLPTPVPTGASRASGAAG